MVFYLLVGLGVVILWFLLAFAFRPLGKFLYRLGHEASEAMGLNNDRENENKEEKEN